MIEVTVVLNGTPRLLLKPSTELERMALQQMAKNSENGCTTALKSPAEGGVDFSLWVGEKA